MSRDLSRRAFLGGAGVCIALPWLESLSPRVARAAEPLAPPVRSLFYYTPNGMHMPEWTPSIAGVGYDLPTILQPLAAIQDEVMVFSGLDNTPGRPEGAGDHAGGTSAFLTCVQAKKTEGADIELGISVDQVAANAIGHETSRPSLQLGMQGGASTGGCDSGYSCAYSRNITWSGPHTPLPKIVSPSLAFNYLFGGFDAQASAAALERRKRYRLSILDHVMDQAASLKLKLGKTDSQKVDEYFDSVRALELRVETGAGELSCDPGVTPGNESWSIVERSGLMNELMVLAFQCDMTRIISFMLGNAGSNWSFPWLGVSGAHHEISHHQDLQDNFDKLTVIDQWEVAQFADLVGRLKAIPEGEGTLLDNCMVYFSSEVEDGNAHRHTNMPVLLAGRGGGAVSPGRHVVVDSETPVANLFLSMLHAMGVPEESFGNSTGLLGDLAG